MNKCKIQNCGKPIKRGFICYMHRSRFARHGNYDISPNWDGLKGGQAFLTNYGYLRVRIDGKRVLQHRYVMEQHLGRKLKLQERVHHINHVRTDNRIENLELIDNHREHMRKHHGNSWQNRKINPPVPESIKREIFEIAKNHVRKIYKGKCRVKSCASKSRSIGLCSKHSVWYFTNR